MVDYSSTDSSKAPKHTTHESAQGVRLSPGPFIGVVKNNVDPMRAGRLQIWISELGGDPDDSTAWRTVQYASPFFGVTPPPRTSPSAENPSGEDRRPSGQNFKTNPHAYGFWMTPPDLGVKVICTFINGDPFKGYWFACVPDWPNMHMVPAIGGKDGPVVEHNEQPGDVSKITEFYNRQKTPHDIVANQLKAQGLSQDRDRGIITSSAFRESPSQVFGFSTPGRALAQPSFSPDGEGDIEPNVTARRGGHSFVMDDGDVDGKSQLIRLRSAAGHQIMMHDTTGFIYLITASGKAWIEMDAGGNINFYADGQFNAKSRGPMNFESMAGVKIKGASVDILGLSAAKVTGVGSLDLSSTGLAKVNGAKGLHLKGSNTYLTGDDCIQINGGKHIDASAGCITLNGKQASKAQAAGRATPPTGMPTKEPWSGHKRGGKAGSGLAVVYPGSVVSGGIAGGYGNGGGYSGINPGGSNVGSGGLTSVSTGGGTGGPPVAVPNDIVALRVAAFTSTLEAGGLQNQADVYQSILNRSASGYYGGNIFNNVTAREQYSPMSAALYGTTSGQAGAYSNIGLTRAELAEIASKPNWASEMSARFGGKGNPVNAEKIVQDFNTGGPLSKASREFVGDRTEFLGSNQPGTSLTNAARRDGVAGIAGRDTSANTFGYKGSPSLTRAQGTVPNSTVNNNSQPGTGIQPVRADNGFVDPAKESATRVSEKQPTGSQTDTANYGNSTTPGFTDASGAYEKNLNARLDGVDKAIINDRARIEQYKAERAAIEEQRGYLTESEYANAVRIADLKIAGAENMLQTSENLKANIQTEYKNFVLEREDTLEGQRIQENIRLADEKAAADERNALSNNQSLMDDPNKAGPGVAYNNELNKLDGQIAANNEVIRENYASIEKADDLLASGSITQEERDSIVARMEDSISLADSQNRELVDQKDAVQAKIDTQYVSDNYNNQQQGNYDPESGITYPSDTTPNRDIDYDQAIKDQIGEVPVAPTGATPGPTYEIIQGDSEGLSGQETNVPIQDQVNDNREVDFGKSDAQYRAEEDNGFNRAIDPASNYVEEQTYGPGGELVTPPNNTSGGGGTSGGEPGYSGDSGKILEESTKPVTGGSTSTGSGGTGGTGKPENNKPESATKPAC